MTLIEEAKADQQEAADREFERIAFTVAAWFCGIVAVVAAYSLLALCGILPALPWSPIG